MFLFPFNFHCVLKMSQLFPQRKSIIMQTNLLIALSSIFSPHCALGSSLGNIISKELNP